MIEDWLSTKYVSLFGLHKVGGRTRRKLAEYVWVGDDDLGHCAVVLVLAVVVVVGMSVGAICVKAW